MRRLCRHIKGKDDGGDEIMRTRALAIFRCALKQGLRAQGLKYEADGET